MSVPSMRGVVECRLLINYRVDRDVAATMIPATLRPHLVNGWVIVVHSSRQPEVGRRATAEPPIDTTGASDQEAPDPPVATMTTRTWRYCTP